MKTTPRYHFSEIPNDDEGREFLRLIRKYTNRERYKVVAKGQHLAAGENWRLHQYGQPISKSTHIRVYLNKKGEK